MTRWGMAIDLRRCVGCQTCTIACKQEHGLPADTVWRFVADCEVGEYPDVRVEFLPVLCQHCHDAPCEPVCPVYASYHNPDGLNGQVYNRCVGTRYCGNNCPYAVRVFNFYPHE